MILAIEILTLMILDKWHNGINFLDLNCYEKILYIIIRVLAYISFKYFTL